MRSDIRASVCLQGIEAWVKARKRRPALRKIEDNWAGPMANTIETRVRFAMWDAMRLAARLAARGGAPAVLAALKKDQALFDRSGCVRRADKKA